MDVSADSAREKQSWVAPAAVVAVILVLLVVIVIAVSRANCCSGGADPALAVTGRAGPVAPLPPPQTRQAAPCASAASEHPLVQHHPCPDGSVMHVYPRATEIAVTAPEALLEHYEPSVPLALPGPYHKGYDSYLGVDCGAPEESDGDAAMSVRFGHWTRACDKVRWEAPAPGVGYYGPDGIAVAGVESFRKPFVPDHDPLGY